MSLKWFSRCDQYAPPYTHSDSWPSTSCLWKKFGFHSWPVRSLSAWAARWICMGHMTVRWKYFRENNYVIMRKHHKLHSRAIDRMSRYLVCEVLVVWHSSLYNYTLDIIITLTCMYMHASMHTNTVHNLYLFHCVFLCLSLLNLPLFKHSIAVDYWQLTVYIYKINYLQGF